MQNMALHGFFVKKLAFEILIARKGFIDEFRINID